MLMHSLVNVKRKPTEKALKVELLLGEKLLYCTVNEIGSKLYSKNVGEGEET